MNVVKILVGTKSDQMFQSPNLDYIMNDDTFKQNQEEIDDDARRIIKETSISHYFRTSSLLGCNVKNVFDQIITQVIAQRKGLK